ncbi:hypothetical protein EsH8_I_000799 [Colletotrichum jinshuiense]
MTGLSHRLDIAHVDYRNVDCTEQKQQHKSSWLILVCPCFSPLLPSTPATPPPQNRACIRKPVQFRVKGKCPRCLQEDADAEPDRFGPDTVAPERPKNALTASRRKGFIGDRNLHAEGRLGHMHIMKRLWTPNQHGGSNGDSLKFNEPCMTPTTAHHRPNGCRYIVTEAKDQVFLQPVLEKPRKSSMVGSKTNGDVSRTARANNAGKPGGSAARARQNPPLSVIVENLEGEEGHQSHIVGSPQPGSAHSNYTPDMSLDELIDEVEVLWQMAPKRGR